MSEDFAVACVASAPTIIALVLFAVRLTHQRLARQRDDLTRRASVQAATAAFHDATHTLLRERVERLEAENERLLHELEEAKRQLAAERNPYRRGP